MIPPLAPGQKDELQNLVGWKNTFNMRQVTLMNLALTNLGSRAENNLQNSVTYMQNGCITSPIKSLDILRRNIQNAINRDIDNVIKKYLEKFFQPAINNIRNNLGRDSINDDIVKDACCKMLEEAKLMYTTTHSRDSSPYDFSDSESGSIIEYKSGRPNTLSPLFRKRKGSDTDSESSHRIIITNKKKPKPKSLQENLHIRKMNQKNCLQKWNADRITSNTLFIMGSKANKVLGFGQTRGRLYVRHPDLLRYSGDDEDKEWLTQNNLMSPTGGKAYIMVYDDIRGLMCSKDYKHSPNLKLDELKGFEVPSFMISKIKNYIEKTRIELKNELIEFNNAMNTPPIHNVDSSPSTPSDSLIQMDCHSGSTVSSKQSDVFDNIPEMSPASNHSFFNQSPTNHNIYLNNNNSQNHVHQSPNNYQNNFNVLLSNHINDNSNEQDY